MTNTALIFHLHEDTERYNRITGAHFDRAYVIPQEDVLGPHKFSGHTVAVAHDPKTDLWIFFGNCTYSRKTEYEIKRLAEAFGYTFPSDALPVEGRTLRMMYYLPNQSELFSEPQVFETRDRKKWEKAVNIAHEKGYKIVRVDRF